MLFILIIDNLYLSMQWTGKLIKSKSLQNVLEYMRQSSSKPLFIGQHHAAEEKVFCRGRLSV